MDKSSLAPAVRERSFRSNPLPTVGCFEIVHTVGPSIAQALFVAERVHDALCKWSDQVQGCATVFTGLGSDGKPLTEHRHAHIFCEANGPHDAITHVTIWAEMGFDDTACRALQRLNKVWGYGGHDLRLILLNLGQPGDFPDCRLFGPARVWRSLTPFISTRHAKTFRDGRPKIDGTGWQVGSAGHDLLRLLALHPAYAGAKISRDRTLHAGRRELRCLQFQTIRHNGGGRRGSGDAGSFTITFDRKMSGPIALGYGAHFGLGLFVPL